MCDIILALPDSTKSGKMLFGKNSDRPAGECQVLHFSDARRAESRKSIKCSYRDIAETENALATLGARPYWSWGYETGINERGVVGGNTAIYTRSLYEEVNRRDCGLTGMELLRIGLERGNTASKAVEKMTDLLEKYGQWGSAVQGADHEKGSYDNAYIIADAKEAWVLESSGRRWVAERITHGTRTLSNEPTIRNSWSRACPDLETHVAELGWYDKKLEKFDFALAYGDHEHYSRQVSHIRCQRTGTLLQNVARSIDDTVLKSILRDHYEGTFLSGPQFSQYLPDFLTVCMHDAPSKFTWGDTATSLVVEINPEDPAHPLIWFAYSPPCMSVYTALPFDSGMPHMVTKTGQIEAEVLDPSTTPRDQFAEDSLWWRLHRLCRYIAEKPNLRHREVRELFDEIETKHRNQVDEMLNSGETITVQQRGLLDLCHQNINAVITAINELEHRWTN